MATEEQCLQIIEGLNEARMEEVLKNLNEINIGVQNVLKYLYSHPEGASATEISLAEDITPPRITAIVKKLEEKGMVIKISDPLDKRRQIIKLSEDGKTELMDCYFRVKQYIGILIDQLGMDKMETFVSLCKDIKAVFSDCQEERI